MRCIPAISAFRRLRQGDCEFKASATEQNPVSNNIQRDINVIVEVDVVVHS